MSVKFSLFAVVFFVALGAATAGAQTRYVADRLVITVRTGPSTANAITRNLTSGDRVEVLEELPDEGYARVRTDNGTEGWVLAQYLQPERTAALELDALSRDFAESEARVVSLETLLTEAQADLASVSAGLDTAETSRAELTAELEDIRSASANAIQTRDQNDSLRSRVAELTLANDMAQAEIAELRSRQRQSWFIVGAGVLFGGIVIGLVAPSLRRQRRSGW